MDSATTKFILAAYRPSTDDACDPVFREALESLEKDSDLRQWFYREVELAAVLKGALRRIRIPDSLRAEILTGMRISRSSSTP